MAEFENVYIQRCKCDDFNGHFGHFVAMNSIIFISKNKFCAVLSLSLSLVLFTFADGVKFVWHVFTCVRVCLWAWKSNARFFASIWSSLDDYSIRSSTQYNMQCNSSEDREKIDLDHNHNVGGEPNANTMKTKKNSMHIYVINGKFFC